MEVATPDLEKFTGILVEDLAINALLRTGRPLRTAELISTVDGVQVNRELLRNELARSERIIASERRWDLASRVGAQGRTLDGIIENIMRTCAKPVSLQHLAREVSIAKSTRPEAVTAMVKKFLHGRDKFVELSVDTFALDEWLLDTSADEEQLIIVENALDREEGFSRLSAPEMTLSDNGTDEGDWALRVLEKMQLPVSHRVLEFLRWKQQGAEFDPADLMATLCEDSRFVVLTGGFVCTAQTANELKKELTRRASQFQATSAAGPVDVDAALRTEVAPEQRITLRPDEIEEITSHVSSSQMPVSVLSLVQDIFEIAPDDAAFIPTLQAVMQVLDSSRQFQKVGRDRYLLKAAIPDYIYTMPNALRPVHLDIRTMQDERIDVELDDEGLDGDLVEVVHSPEWEETGEEGEVARNQISDAEAEMVVYPVNVLHHRTGTMKLRMKDDTLFPPNANVARLQLVDAEGGVTAVWLSREAGLIYDMGPWYLQHNVDVGHILRLTKTGQPERIQIESRKDRHPLLALEQARIEEFKTLAEDSERRQLSLLDILTTLMYEHSRGAQFITLWHEVNVIRRTTKRLVASVLSSYHCFYPRRQGDEWFWRLDESKIDQGFKRNKRKYVRK